GRGGVPRRPGSLQSSHILLFEPNRRRNQACHTITIHTLTSAVQPATIAKGRRLPPGAIGSSSPGARERSDRQRSGRRGKERGMETLASGYGLIEGPVWDPARGLIFSDVPNGGGHCLDRSGRVETIVPH